VLGHILIEFGVALKLVRLIKTCLNEPILKSVYVKICLTHFLSKMIERRCFNAIAFNFALEYDIRKIKKKKVELKLNGIYQLLV
jgi:hypothetical protein